MQANNTPISRTADLVAELLELVTDRPDLVVVPLELVGFRQCPATAVMPVEEHLACLRQP